jgi:site-specific DNA-adenine methylase
MSSNKIKGAAQGFGVLKAPFPYSYYGGKSAIAAEVWARFGAVKTYIEPFFGSGAVWLGCPLDPPPLATVNDINADLCNFWRTLAADPDATAKWADYPVSEIDTHSRGDALFYGADRPVFIERLRGDPDFFDAKRAGWWVWFVCSWIGDLPDPRKGPAVGAGRPHLGRETGVARQLPHLGDAGVGVNRQLPHLGGTGAGMGVNRGSFPAAEPLTGDRLRPYFHALAERFARVRICCGDWARVCGPSVTTVHGMTGVFLDPPYAAPGRASVYGEHEDFKIHTAVREWAIEAGANPLMRVALCGYDEHDGAMPRGWKPWRWKARGGYASQRKTGKNENRAREIIWFSPACLDISPALF